jgi:hypothetical protein
LAALEVFITIVALATVFLLSITLGVGSDVIVEASVGIGVGATLSTWVEVGVSVGAELNTGAVARIGTPFCVTTPP